MMTKINKMGSLLFGCINQLVNEKVIESKECYYIANNQLEVNFSQHLT